MSKYLFFFILMVFSTHSAAAGLRCEHLFPPDKKDVVTAYALSIDELNSNYNSFLFKKNLADVIAPKLDDSPFWERTRARYQAYKLRKILQQLFDHDSFHNPSASDADRYAIEKIAVKLEKLAFLADESVMAKMSIAEKIVFRQARHSLLAQGLEQFLFANEPRPPQSITRKIFSTIMLPFRDQYFRWVYAIGFMPKLNGAAIPLEVIERVVWNGYENNKDLLRPYLAKTESKYFFNVFSSTYNWILAGVVMTAVGNLTHTAYYDVYLGGQEKAQKMLAPTLASSEKMAATDWAAFKQKRRLANVVTEFKLKYEREPNPAELEFLKSLIETTK